MGAPFFAPKNHLEDCTLTKAQPLAAGSPQIWSIPQSADGFPASAAIDSRPGTIVRFASLAVGALVAQFAAGKAADCIGVINHNLPADAQLFLQGSNDGVAWADVSNLSALLGEKKFHKRFALATWVYWALTLRVLGSLGAPWELGEWFLGSGTLFTRNFGWGLVDDGVGGRNVDVATPYGIVGSKHLNMLDFYEGDAAEGLTPAELAEWKSLVIGTKFGAVPCLFAIDADNPKAILGRVRIEEWHPRLVSVNRYGGVELRVEELPWGKTAA